MSFFTTISSLSTTEKAFWGSAAVVGVPLIFNLVKDIGLDWRKRKEERAFISVQLVFLLDKFVASCADVAWDQGYDPYYPEPDEHELKPQAKIPVFDMSIVKGEHKYLKPGMLYKLHNIEIELRLAGDSLNYLAQNPSFSADDYYSYYELRRKLYAYVGLYAADISDDLRKKFKIRKTEGWEPKLRIVDSLNSIKKEKSIQAISKMKRRAERAMM